MAKYVQKTETQVSRISYSCEICGEMEDGGFGPKDRERMRATARNHVAQTGHKIVFVVEYVTVYHTG